MDLFLLMISLQLMGGVSLVIEVFKRTKSIILKEVQGELNWKDPEFSDEDKVKVKVVNFNVCLKRISAIYFIIGYLMAPFVEKSEELVFSVEYIIMYLKYIFVCLIIAVTISFIITVIFTKNIKGADSLK